MKLASNEGAFGPLPEAMAAYEAAAAELNRYPDAGAASLRAGLAERHGLAPEQVIPGNGADELIRLCGSAVLDAGDAAVFPWPSFPSYVAAAAVHGADAVRVPLRERRFDLDALLDACARPAPGGGRVRAVFLANPNNPTGTLLSREEVRGFLDALPDRILCVLDEAYADYADEEPEGPALRARGPRAAVRAAHLLQGLRPRGAAGGLRAGLARGRRRARSRAPDLQPQPAGPGGGDRVAGLSMAVAGREHARAARGRLFADLESAGLDPIVSQANFVYADVPGGDGDGLADELLHEGSSCAPCAASGRRGRSA